MELERAKAIVERIKKRFWPKVLVSQEPDGCWLWIGARTSDGYGNIKVAGRAVSAHRIAHQLQIGPIPEGQSVLHSCDNPACVRGAHLFLGLQADNIADMHSKGRANKAQGGANGSRLYLERRPRGDTHCFRLHPELHARGEKVGIAKLTVEQVLKIRRRLQERLPRYVVAREFDVCTSSIQNIASGKTWRHI